MIEIISILGAFISGMYVNELLRKRRILKTKEHRILIDAPFSPEQSDSIMKALKILSDSISERTSDNG